MSHVFVVLALLWYALVPAISRTSGVEGPSVRGHRATVVQSFTGARTTMRETTREEAPSPFEAVDAQATVAPAGSFRRSAPTAPSATEPDLESFTAVARGPPAR